VTEWIFLDTNAHSHLFGHSAFTSEQLGEVRRRVLDRVEKRDARVLLSVLVLEEMAGAYDLGHFEEMVAFAMRLARGLVLRIPPERCFAELVLGRRLSEQERFYMANTGLALHAALMHRATAGHLAASAQRKKATVRRLSTCRKRNSIALLAKHAAEQGHANWQDQLKSDFANRDAMLASWCLREMRVTAKRHGLTMTDDSMPDPRKLPTFWYMEAQLAATLERVIIHDGSTTSEKPPDVFDWMHFADCGYADVLVTEDRRLRALAEAACVPLRVTSFVDWANAILA
jgi:hypothetical protein